MRGKAQKMAQVPLMVPVTVRLWEEPTAPPSVCETVAPMGLKMA